MAFVIMWVYNNVNGDYVYHTIHHHTHDTLTEHCNKEQLHIHTHQMRGSLNYSQ